MRTLVACLIVHLSTVGIALADDTPIADSIARQAQALAAQAAVTRQTSVIAEDCRRVARVGALVGGIAAGVLGLRVAADVPHPSFGTVLVIVAASAWLGAEGGARFGTAIGDGCDR